MSEPIPVKSWLVVTAFLLITALPMLYGNVVAKKGGLLDDTLLNLDDPYFLMDQRVKGYAAEGLRTGDAVGFVIPLTDGGSAESLAKVKRFTDDLKTRFPEFGILSLSTVANYQDTGEELLNKPYLTEQVLEKMRLDPVIETTLWREAVRRNAGVYGVLIGKNFDHAVVNLLLPEGYDDIATFRRVVEFLEQRTISPWAWYLKTDIYPSGPYQDVLPAGWVVGRGLMDAALLSDILTLSSMGLCLVGVAFFFSLISLRQALVATSVVVLSFIWIRGSLGLLQVAGCNLAERVYFLLVYTALIVSGISFAERKFSSYNDTRRQFPDLSRAGVWQRSRSVNELILMTGMISVLNFATLYQIQIRGILEVGILSALGILFLLALVLWYLPALHIIIGGEARPTPRTWTDRFGARWNGLLKAVVEYCHRIVDPGYPDGPYRPRVAARRFLILILAVIILAAGLVVSDFLPFGKRQFQLLEIKTSAMEYLRKTVIHQTAEVLNHPGNVGFDRMSVLLMPKEQGNGAAVYSPEFLARAEAFSRRAAEIPEVRQASSILDTVKLVARESYQRELPATNQQAHDILETIEWDLGTRVKEQLWFDRGIVLFTSTAKDDTRILSGITEQLMGVAAREFPDLTVLPFGKFAIYPQADRYIREGKPVNMLTSQWMLVLAIVPWVVWRNRRRRHGGRRMYGWRAGLIANTPFVFASAAIVLVMIGLRVPLDQATACVTALAINAAVDFGLYLTADFQTFILEGQAVREGVRYALVERGKVIVVDVVLNAFCFVPLITSSFLPVARLGWVMIVMLMACGFGALVIMPSLLPWCVRTNENKERNA